jgi:hypothetical protein
LVPSSVKVSERFYTFIFKIIIPPSVSMWERICRKPKTLRLYDAVEFKSESSGELHIESVRRFLPEGATLSTAPFDSYDYFTNPNQAGSEEWLSTRGTFILTASSKLSGFRQYDYLAAVWATHPITPFVPFSKSPSIATFRAGRPVHIHDEVLDVFSDDGESPLELAQGGDVSANPGDHDRDGVQVHTDNSAT